MNKDIVTLSNNERGVTVITLNRPEVHNAFDGELVHSLSMALKSVEEDENVRIVIIAANGKSFCAGADIKWMRQMGLANEDENSIALCLIAFVYSIRLSSHSGMSLARDTFVNALAKFTTLGSIKEKWIEPYPHGNGFFILRDVSD